MTFDREDWAKGYKARLQERMNGKRTELEHFMQAEVQAERLTGDPDWDIFLQLVQAGIERMQKLANELRRQLADPGTVNQDELMRLKISLADAEGHVRAWEATIQLPKDIKQSGEQAKTLLERLDIG